MSALLPVPTAPTGDVVAVARVAAIAGAERSPEPLPLAHVIAVHAAPGDLEVTRRRDEVAR